MINQSNPLDEYSDLPRPELREDAFRRYELILYRAQREGSVVIEPTVFDMRRAEHIKLSPSTYIARIRDAIRGHQKYKYESKVKADFPWETISFSEVVGGMVRIRNSVKLLEQMEKDNAAYIRQDEVVQKELHEKPATPEIVPLTEDQEAELTRQQRPDLYELLLQRKIHVAEKQEEKQHYIKLYMNVKTEPYTPYKQ